MNFQKLHPITFGQDFLDIAFRKARQKGKSKKLTGNWLQIIRQKEALKLDVVKDNLVLKLQKILDDFPKYEELGSFYNKLMDLTIDKKKYSNSLGGIDWGIKQIRKLHKSYVSKIVKCKDKGEIKELSKQFYGRVSSVVAHIDKGLVYLEECRKIMKTYPDVKEMFTVCLYGFPNVGKTTLLNKLTGTKAEVAAYSFTTKKINAGYFDVNSVEIQVLDVPGTLAREEKMNKVELQAELVKNDLADVIVYVFDLSGQNAHSIEVQEELFRKLGKKVLVYFSKLDLIDEDISKYVKKYQPLDLEGLKKKIGKMV